jgi:tetratricopeptide (TPR) repeat protein
LAVLGEIYTDLDDWNNAENHLRKALALDPHSILALRNQAFLYEQQGKYQQAIDVLDLALAQNPRRSDLFIEKARIYRMGLADIPQALNAYQAAVDAHRTPVTLDALGEALNSAGDHLLAVRLLREAVELNPHYGPALVHLGMALYARNNYEDAVTYLAQGLAIIDGNAREEQLATLGIAYIYKEPRACDLALPWLRKALAQSPISSLAVAGMKLCAPE